MLKERRNKSFPQILGIIEQIIIQNKKKKQIVAEISQIIENLLNEKIKFIDDNQYDLLWLIYFAKSLNLFTITFPSKIQSKLLKSLKLNSVGFFNPIPSDIKLFTPIKKTNIELLKYLSLFKKEEE